MQSALYVGKVHHARHIPTKHAFSYQIFLFWLALDEVEQLVNNVKGIGFGKASPVRYRREDYLGDPSVSHQDAVLARMNELSDAPLTGRVFMLGQLRMFGLYFSPVNFYYLQRDDGIFSHMLAEVSNTPWNERHHYLVDLQHQQDAPKAFHVSPFNPMDMTYTWRVAQPADRLDLAMSCVKETRHFDASLQMTKRELNSRTLFNVMCSIPSMTVKTVVGIYWQALKLLIKGTPIYDHPTTNTKENEC